MSGSRQFFALWPDPDTRETLVRIQQGLDVAAARRVHAQDLHLTLAFLGQVAADRQDCVLAAAGAVQTPGFELRLDRVGAWPGPRVAWAGATDRPPALLALVDQLWRGLAGCGFTREARAYRPHVTLLRKCAALPEITLPAPVSWRAAEFVLAESQAPPAVPRYRILRRWALAAPDPGHE